MRIYINEDRDARENAVDVKSAGKKDGGGLFTPARRGGASHRSGGQSLAGGTIVESKNRRIDESTNRRKLETNRHEQHTRVRARRRRAPYRTRAATPAPHRDARHCSRAVKLPANLSQIDFLRDRKGRVVAENGPRTLAGSTRGSGRRFGADLRRLGRENSGGRLSLSHVFV